MFIRNIYFFNPSFLYFILCLSFSNNILFSYFQTVLTEGFKTQDAMEAGQDSFKIVNLTLFTCDNKGLSVVLL